MELKPCPFCGHKAEIKCESTGTSSQEYRFFKTFIIWCPHCGATQNRRAAVTIDYFPHIGVVIDDGKLKESITSWDRRADNA